MSCIQYHRNYTFNIFFLIIVMLSPFTTNSIYIMSQHIVNFQIYVQNIKS